MPEERKKAIDSFLDYLVRSSNQLAEKISPHILQRKYSHSFFDYIERKYIIRVLKTDSSEWKEHFEIFTDYEVLSNLLMKSLIDATEKMEVIFFLIQKNIATGLLNSNRKTFDFDQVDNYPFQYFTKEEIKELIQAKKYYSNLSKPDDLLTEEEKAKQKELYQFLQDCPLKDDNMVVLHRNIQKHYFDKKDNLTEEDVNIIISSLLQLKIDKSICQDIKDILLKKDITLLLYRDHLIRFFEKTFPQNEKEEKQDLSLPYMKETIMIVKNYIGWLSEEALLTKKHVIIPTFSYFEDISNGSNLKKKELIHILFYIVKRNINTGILKKDVTLNKQLYFSFDNDFNFDNQKEYRHFYEKFQSTFLPGISSLPEHENELISLFDTDFDFKEIQKAYQTIQDHYLKQLFSFTKEDINLIIDAFKTLKLSDHLCLILTSYLQKELETRKRIEIKNMPISPSFKDKKVILSTKEYNQIYRNLLTYFDFDEMKPIRALSLSEIIYCINQLTKLNIDNQVIQKFLMRIDKQNLYHSFHPITRYLDMKEKIEYYQKDEEIQMILEDLENEFQKIFISDAKDYQQVKRNIKDDISLFEELIPQGFEYEYSKIKKSN